MVTIADIILRFVLQLYLFKNASITNSKSCRYKCMSLSKVYCPVMFKIKSKSNANVKCNTWMCCI